MTGAALRRALAKKGYNIVPLSPRAHAIEEVDLQDFIMKREGYSGVGRPHGAKSKPKEDATQEHLEEGEN